MQAKHEKYIVWRKQIWNIEKKNIYETKEKKKNHHKLLFVRIN